MKNSTGFFHQTGNYFYSVLKSGAQSFPYRQNIYFLLGMPHAWQSSIHPAYRIHGPVFRYLNTSFSYFRNSFDRFSPGDTAPVDHRKTVSDYINDADSANSLDFEIPGSKKFPSQFHSGTPDKGKTSYIQSGNPIASQLSDKGKTSNIQSGNPIASQLSDKDKTSYIQSENPIASQPSMLPDIPKIVKEAEEIHKNNTIPVKNGGIGTLSYKNNREISQNEKTYVDTEESIQQVDTILHSIIHNYMKMPFTETKKTEKGYPEDSVKKEITTSMGIIDRRSSQEIGFHPHKKQNMSSAVLKEKSASVSNSVAGKKKKSSMTSSEKENDPGAKKNSDAADVIREKKIYLKKTHAKEKIAHAFWIRNYQGRFLLHPIR